MSDCPKNFFTKKPTRKKTADNIYMAGGGNQTAFSPYPVLGIAFRIPAEMPDDSTPGEPSQ